jgi:hypothetical protein
MNETVFTAACSGVGSFGQSPSLPLHEFQVRVGLAECTVVCHTPDEAIRLARVRIAEKMPQTRILLGNILDKEFRVDCVQ